MQIRFIFVLFLVTLLSLSTLADSDSEGIGTKAKQASQNAKDGAGEMSNKAKNTANAALGDDTGSNNDYSQNPNKGPVQNTGHYIKETLAAVKNTFMGVIGRGKKQEL